MTNKEMNKLKKTELEILDYFTEFCDKHNLTYQLTYGTLLGAIRHKGFIPWDDDIDVHMPPEDYLKFLELMKEEKHDQYFLQNIDTEKYYHTYFTKIRKDNSCMIEKEWQYIKIHKGINIDIFPLFPYPENKKDRKKVLFNLKTAVLLASKNNKKGNIKVKIIYAILKLIPRKITNKIASKLIKKTLQYNKEYNSYILTTYSKPLKKEWFKKSITVPFEDKQYKIPAKYDEILTTIYGDYMTPPKEEDRTGHGEIIISFDKNYEDITE